MIEREATDSEEDERIDVILDTALRLKPQQFAIYLMQFNIMGVLVLDPKQRKAQEQVPNLRTLEEQNTHDPFVTPKKIKYDLILEANTLGNFLTPLPKKQKKKDAMVRKLNQFKKDKGETIKHRKIMRPWRSQSQIAVYKELSQKEQEDYCQELITLFTTALDVFTHYFLGEEHLRRAAKNLSILFIACAPTFSDFNASILQPHISLSQIQYYIEQAYRVRLISAEWYYALWPLSTGLELYSQKRITAMMQQKEPPDFDLFDFSLEVEQFPLQGQALQLFSLHFLRAGFQTPEARENVYQSIGGKSAEVTSFFSQRYSHRKAVLKPLFEELSQIPVESSHATFFDREMHLRLIKGAISGRLAYIPYLLKNIEHKAVRAFYKRIGGLILELPPVEREPCLVTLSGCFQHLFDAQNLDSPGSLMLIAHSLQLWVGVFRTLQAQESHKLYDLLSACFIHEEQLIDVLELLIVEALQNSPSQRVQLCAAQGVADLLFETKRLKLDCFLGLITGHQIQKESAEDGWKKTLDSIIEKEKSQYEGISEEESICSSQYQTDSEDSSDSEEEEKDKNPLQQIDYDSNQPLPRTLLSIFKTAYLGASELSQIEVHTYLLHSLLQGQNFQNKSLMTFALHFYEEAYQRDDPLLPDRIDQLVKCFLHTDLERTFLFAARLFVPFLTSTSRPTLRCYISLALKQTKNHHCEQRIATMGFFLKRALDVFRNPEQLIHCWNDPNTMLQSGELKQLIKSIQAVLFRRLLSKQGISLIQHLLVNWSPPPYNVSHIKLKDPLSLRLLQPQPGRLFYSSEDQNSVIQKVDIIPLEDFMANIQQNKEENKKEEEEEDSDEEQDYEDESDSSEEPRGLQLTPEEQEARLLRVYGMQILVLLLGGQQVPESRLPGLIFSYLANMYSVAPLFSESILCCYFYIMYELMLEDEQDYCAEREKEKPKKIVFKKKKEETKNWVYMDSHTPKQESEDEIDKLLRGLQESKKARQEEMKKKQQKSNKRKQTVQEEKPQKGRNLTIERLQQGVNKSLAQFLISNKRNNYTQSGTLKGLAMLHSAQLYRLQRFLTFLEAQQNPLYPPLELYKSSQTGAEWYQESSRRQVDKKRWVFEDGSSKGFEMLSSAVLHAQGSRRLDESKVLDLEFKRPEFERYFRLAQKQWAEMRTVLNCEDTFIEELVQPSISRVRGLSL